jgi:hypothetical protein
MGAHCPVTHGMPPIRALRERETRTRFNRSRVEIYPTSLRYLVNTRSDIAFVVSYVSRFLSKPHEDHLIAVKHILCYVARTVNWGIHLKKGSGQIAQIVFSDSDFAVDVINRKSTSRIFFFLDRSLVTWQSTKQNIVAQSISKAEYVAAANRTCQAIWLGRVLGELLGTEAFVPGLMVDN